MPTLRRFCCFSGSLKYLQSKPCGFAVGWKPTLRRFCCFGGLKCPLIKSTKFYHSLGLNPTVRYTSAHTWRNCAMSSAVVCGVLAFVVFMLSNPKRHAPCYYLCLCDKTRFLCRCVYYYRPFFVLCRLLTVCYNKKSAFHSIESEKIRHFTAVLFFFFFFANQFFIFFFY